MPNRMHKQATAKAEAKAERAEAQAAAEAAAVWRVSSEVISVGGLFPVAGLAAVLVVVVNGGGDV